MRFSASDATIRRASPRPPAIFAPDFHRDGVSEYRAMKNYWLEKAKGKKKCRYRPLTPREVDAADPHRIKGRGGSKRDLAVCVGPGCEDQGAIVEHRKKKYYDKDGNIVRPKEKDIHYEPVGININDPEFIEKLDDEPTITETRVVIRLFVAGFDADPESVVGQLGIGCEESWKEGEPRFEGSLLLHDDNGFAIGPSAQCNTFETRVLSVLRKVHQRRGRLRKLVGEYEAELSIGVYVVGDDVPDFHLPKEAIALLSDLGGEVDYDLYFLPKPEQQE